MQHLLDVGAIERKSRDRYVLSRRYYAMVGGKGRYTRARGLDRETHKQLLLKHITDNAAEGSPMGELMQVLPECSRGQIRGLMDELRAEGLVHLRGQRRGAKWYPGPAP